MLKHQASICDTILLYLLDQCNLYSQSYLSLIFLVVILISRTPMVYDHVYENVANNINTVLLHPCDLEKQYEFLLFLLIKYTLQ